MQKHYSDGRLSFRYNQKRDVVYRTLTFLGFLLYRVGTDGSIWSWFYGKRKWKRRNLRTYPGWGGYIRVDLYNEIGMKWFLVHRLILMTFWGECPSGTEACHDNGIRDDNRIENLMWRTKKRNQWDRIRHGTDMRGEKHPNAKTTEGEVLSIREMHATGRYSAQKLADMFNMTVVNIRYIIHRRAWKHI